MDKKNPRTPLLHIPYSWLDTPSADRSVELDECLDEERVFPEAVKMTLDAWLDVVDPMVRESGIDTRLPVVAQPHTQQGRYAVFLSKSIRGLKSELEQERDPYSIAYSMMWIGHWVQSLEETAIHDEYESLSRSANLPKDYREGLADFREQSEATMLETAFRQQRGLVAYNDLQKRNKERNKAKARELKNQGYTHAAIANEMQIDVKTVSRYLKKEK